MRAALPLLLLSWTALAPLQTDRPRVRLDEAHHNVQLNMLRWLSRGMPGQAVREMELPVTGKAAGMLGGGRVSPDGRYISFADQLAARAGGTGNLAIWDTQTGETRIVTTASNTTPWADGFAEDSAWSADGQSIAYAWAVEAPGRPRELRLVDVASGQHRILFRPPAGVTRIHPFAFSPDGRHVLLALGRMAGEGTIAAAEIAMVATSDGTKRTLEAFDGSLPAGAVFSRDGKWIAFDYQPRGSTSRDIAIMAVAPGGPEHTIGSLSSHDVVLGWLPDGRLLFTSFSAGRTDALTVLVTDGRPAPASTVVKRDAGELSPQGVTRDGRVFLHRADNTREVLVADVDPITGKARGDAYPLPGTTPGLYRSEPAWSPDGSTIAYVESAPGLPQGVIIHNVKTGSTRRYEVGVRGIDWPRWQPDARAFIFDGTGSDNVQRSHRLWLDSGKVEPLVAGLVFGVSPDSRVFYYGGPGLDLTRRAFADGATTTIAARAELGSVQGTTLSPDGRWFAYLTGAGRQRGIAIRAVDGGATKILVKETAAGYPRIAWTPDSRYVVFVRNPDGLHRISIDGGDPEPLNVVVRGVIGEKSVSPDGKRIAFGVSRNSTHLVVWDNFATAGFR